MNTFLVQLKQQRDQKVEQMLSFADEIKALNLLISNQPTNANYRPGDEIVPINIPETTATPGGGNTVTVAGEPSTIQVSTPRAKPLVPGTERKTGSANSDEIHDKGSANTSFLSPEQANASTMPADKD